VSNGEQRPVNERVAIVTGAAGAFGHAYCRALALEGYSIVAADLRPADALVAEITQAGGRAVAIECDVSERAATEAMAARTVEELGRIDVLINNAAYFSTIEKKPFEEITDGEWDLAFAVNVRGAWLCSCAVVPAMRSQGGGRIINTSSMTLHGVVVSGFAHYVATKAAIVGLTRALARELGKDNIAVNTISPDYVEHEGPMFERQPEMVGMLAAQRSFARPMTPEDLVGTVLFLASDRAGFVTGQDIWVNGGRLVP
jgi:NAD(P)-dependent dehydrogenase (short-subunit alcohol dehydrogenase family)